MTNRDHHSIILKLTRNAAIAQPVERILGKDEVASSNLASSSKPLNLLESQGFFLFLHTKSDRILLPHFTGKDAVYLRQKINISTHLSTSLKAVYESFIISQTSRGISDATITKNQNHLRGIAKHIDIDMPFDELSKRHLEQMVVSMREAGLAHNSIANYLRVFNTFLRWCQREGLSDITIPNLKEKDTVISASNT